MANENKFDNKGENYAKGRPSYSEGAFEMIFNDLLKPGDKIADIGSGTGIFSKEFIARGYDVYCVEPNADMRAQAEAFFGDDPHFISVTAPAEATTLPDHSVNLVTAASAFHWFDAEKFREECKRILVPGGYVCLVINARDYKDEFTLRQHELCQETCIKYESLRHGFEKTHRKAEKFFGDELNFREFAYPLEYSRETFIARSLSSSYAPQTDENGYNPYAEGLEKLMDEFGIEGKFILANSTMVHFGKIK